MACNHPIPGYRDHQGAVAFGHSNRAPEKLRIPCNDCIACHQTRAIQWALRCEHETSQSNYNIFLNLTYDNEKIPRDNNLTPWHLTQFIKTLRQHLSRHPDDNRAKTNKIRYFACGEYGGQTGRPHYHIIIFNYRPAEEISVGKSKSGNALYQSALIGRIWNHGLHKYGVATGAAAAYIAKYSLKDTHYKTWNNIPGWLRDLIDTRHQKPFMRCSLKPGIGAEWLNKYQTDLKHGYLVQKTFKKQIPRYYKKLLEQNNNQLYEKVQQKLQYYATLETDKNNRDRQLANDRIMMQKKLLTKRGL